MFSDRAQIYIKADEKIEQRLRLGFQGILQHWYNMHVCTELLKGETSSFGPQLNFYSTAALTLVFDARRTSHLREMFFTI